MTSALHNQLILAAVFFALGVVGFLARRNLILMFLSVEMMLQGVALNLVAFSRYHEHFGGQSFTAFIITVAACEAAIAMALFIVLYRQRRTLDVRVWSALCEIEPPSAPAPPHAPVEPAAPTEIEFPPLTPAGRAPVLEERKVSTHV